jgi:hypothetical protein
MVGEPVRAQTLFVDGGAFAGIERRPHIEIVPIVPGGEQPDLGGTVPGGVVSIGTWLAPRVSVRLEVALPGNLETTDEQGTVYPLAFPLGPSSLGPDTSFSYSQRYKRSERIRSLSALVGYHTARRRGLQLGYLGGAAFLVGRRTETYEFGYPVITNTIPIGILPPMAQTTIVNEYGVTATVGLDADVAVGSRLSLVPHVRAFAFSSGLSVRPGVVVRVRW